MFEKEVMESCAPFVKDATRIKHEEAEAVMMPLIKQATTVETYGALLQQLYGFYRPMEQLMAPFAVSMRLPDGPFRRTHLLDNDLQHLGLLLPKKYCNDLPELSNEYQLLGALYVLEGAALGGRVIARMLQAPQTLPDNVFHFFKGREEETGKHWKKFTQFLNEHAHTTSQIQAVSDAACATFSKYSNWMKPL